MKSIVFALVLAASSMASAATTCVAMGQGASGDYDQVLAQKFVPQTGEATVVYTANGAAYLAIDNGRNLSIALATTSASGTTDVTTLASGNGNQLVFLDVASKIGIGCSRQ